MEEVEAMETSIPTQQPPRPRVEYIVIDEGGSSALEDVFDMLFESVAESISKE